jgi:fatty acid desaturase
MKTEAQPQPGEPLMAQARALVNDLFVRSTVRHWSDMLCSLSIGVAAFIATPALAPYALLAALAFVVSVLALYRAAIFVHEIAHFDPGDLPGFRLVWDLLCGAPMLVPSFLYDHHRDHHLIRSYATVADAEYFPFASKGRASIVLFLAANALIPLAAYLRMLVLTPLSWLSPTISGFTHTYASALSINPEFRAEPLRNRAERHAFRAREALSFVYALVPGWLFLRGDLTLSRVVQAWAVLGTVAILNGLRILVAHRYESASKELSLREQILDSCNFPYQVWFNSLWAPVGLRFHALHHLFPRLPYHALAQAHERLIRGLPDDSFYHQVTQPSLRVALAALWRSAERQAISPYSPGVRQ